MGAGSIQSGTDHSLCRSLFAAACLCLNNVECQNILETFLDL